MISMKFSQFMNQEYNDRGQGHELYVLKGEGCVLYVGISKVGIWWRWFSAPRSHLFWVNDQLNYGSSVGEAVVRCAPESMDWTMHLWSREDCIKFLRDEIRDRAMENHLRRDIRFCEDLMIDKLKPCLNVAGAAFRYANLPERIRRYKEEQENRAFEAYDRIFNKGHSRD